MTSFEHPRPEEFPPVPRYGTLQLSSRYLLSPLAGFTNLSFRRVVREVGGVGLATTDLVNARGIVADNRKTLQLIATCPTDRPFAVQIFGSDRSIMRDAAQILEEKHHVDTIDINMGCPVDRIVKSGSGASMMCQADATIGLVQHIVESVKIPVSVKMRLGWDAQTITAPKFAREFEQVGVVAIAIHGRTREQGFRGAVDLEGIRLVAEAVDKIPVIGNGDVRTIADAARMLTTTGCQGVSIGRGALANPWIFRQLVEWETTGTYAPPGSFLERMELLQRQYGYLEELLGAKNAIITFRKMGHWYLKAMRVLARLRNDFQQVNTRAELDDVLARIAEAGPVQGTKDGILPDMHVPVPSGPVERW